MTQMVGNYWRSNEVQRDQREITETAEAVEQPDQTNITAGATEQPGWTDLTGFSKITSSVKV